MRSRLTTVKSQAEVVLDQQPNCLVVVTARLGVGDRLDDVAVLGVPLRGRQMSRGISSGSVCRSSTASRSANR